MHAKLEMFIFRSMYILKSKRCRLPIRSPIHQTSRIQGSGPNHGLKGTRAHEGRLGGEIRAEKMGWTERMMTKKSEGDE